MLPRFGALNTTIRRSVISVFLLATLLTVALAVCLQYYFGQLVAKQTASSLYSATADAVAAELRGIGQVNINVINLLADNEALTAKDSNAERLTVFADALAQNPLYYGIYIGSGSGDFYEVINLDASPEARTFYGADAQDKWLILEDLRVGNKKMRQHLFLDHEFQLHHSRSEETLFDVASRPWYQSAMQSNAAQLNQPYLFAQLQLPGRTLSKRIAGTDQVVAIDIMLSSISELLRNHQIARTSDVYLFTLDGGRLASSKPPVIDAGAGTDGDELAAAESDDLNWLVLEGIAANEQDHMRLVAKDVDGRPHLAYVIPVGDGNDPIYMGIVANQDSIFDPVLDKVKLSGLLTTGILLCLLPLSWFFANPIVRPVKQLAVENEKVKKREFDKVERIGTHVRELDELSESMVSMVASIQQYEQEQKQLMEAIIKLIAEAIDDKSSHTGGHCERVPELALMLAECASASDLPAFADFRLNTEQQWQEYRIAAWLHDCGKITTPEHIVDKGSKLEAIYNRIHEIRTRFEVLWRDEEILYWKAIAQNPQAADAHRAELEKKQRQLQEDFAFIARCNVGGESLDQPSLQQLQALAGREWVRHFDDRMGLSPAEEQQSGTTRKPLPVTERLLSDKPEHLIRRDKPTDYAPQLGINMDIPEYEANLGELYNLSVSRGTLTREDRFRIQEHMISTVKMLDNLPFPDELKNVPRYASTHHETMKGTGYPRRLSGAQLSIPERLLAVADVFEALTAADRPYKKAKPISAALDILHNMVRDNHIDRDCFELFIREKIYLRYAQAFLPQSQIDTVDTEKYVRALDQAPARSG
jgi:HD-GYP domain-containing protein (c-di-GMP phosphodiesterase class II)